MQTFLPYPSFAASAKVLDRQRLGKQRVETMQILHVLTGKKAGWRNHPAVKMWQGYEGALAEYGVAICQEWKSRGYKDTCQEKIEALAIPDSSSVPLWMGADDFHLSHRSNLLRKDREHYGQYWDDADDLPYVWPSKDDKAEMKKKLLKTNKEK
jgi:hypothetical protein